MQYNKDFSSETENKHMENITKDVEESILASSSEPSNKIDDIKNNLNISSAVVEALSYSEIRNNCYIEEYVSQHMIFKMLKKHEIFYA